MTDLPGIKETITNCCGDSDNIQYVPLPKMKSIDQPVKEDLPEFIKKLKELMISQLKNIEVSQKDYEYSERIREMYGWDALFKKYFTLYNSILNL